MSDNCSRCGKHPRVNGRDYCVACLCDHLDRMADDGLQLQARLTAALAEVTRERDALATSREEWMARCQEKSDDKADAIQAHQEAESALSAANARQVKLERVAEKAGVMSQTVGGIVGTDDAWREKEIEAYYELRAALDELKKGST